MVAKLEVDHILLSSEYILLIEKFIGQQISGYGVGPSREGYRKREEAFK